jgi:hypothetical protein
VALRSLRERVDRVGVILGKAICLVNRGMPEPMYWLGMTRGSAFVGSNIWAFKQGILEKHI